MSLLWKPDWGKTQERLTAWWQHKGLVCSISAPREMPRDPLEAPPVPEALEEYWLDPVFRARKAEYELAHMYFGADCFPYFDTHIGPGNLATFLGSEPLLRPESVWFASAYESLSDMPALHFEPEHPWVVRQRAIIEEGLRRSNHRFLVGMPDLIENLDILASLRGAEALMLDLVDQPDLVLEKIAEINQVYIEAFAYFHSLIRDEQGGNAFSFFRIWGPGKTAKVQCDAAAMISPRMFKRFVVPSLTAQCAWLDYAMFHLDGSQCIPHLDSLLAIDELDAIEFTCEPTAPPAGDPSWYTLYRRILEGGKSLQVYNIALDAISPLLNAIGNDGVFIYTWADTEDEARRAVDQVSHYQIG